MPKQAIPLTDAQIKQAKPKDKPYKLSDSKGLYLIVNPNGGKWWWVNYLFDKKQMTLSVGTYPTVSLINARQEALKLKEQVRQGIKSKPTEKRAKRSRTAKEAR